MKTLFLFPAVYPYNMYGDNFLETETEYLYKTFDMIVIVPYRKETDKLKNVPENCRVLPPILDGTTKFLLRGLFSWPGIKYLIPDLFENKAYKNKTRFSVWLKAYAFLNNLCNRKDIREIGENLKVDDVCYFYWGKWGNLLSIVWKDKAHFVSRFHGEWDLWEESYDGYTPLRSRVASELDLAVFIAQKGERYFKERYPQSKTLFAPYRILCEANSISSIKNAFKEIILTDKKTLINMGIESKRKADSLFSQEKTIARWETIISNE